ncbi:alpha/beta hydrolase family protein [Paenibacillus kobensis]|uniref:alpha/beta hydrolase family protein n=1 Tax=Paenibacillus kobensis TaxID=59841 RepID=UPI000FDCD5FA|nr:alpha/beta fold hydrolase [Paenibacillus kobensis]
MTNGVSGLIHEAFVLERGGDSRIRGDVRVLNAEGASVERRPVIVLLHGFKGFKDWGSFPYAAERLAGHGFAVVTFNFSHNGVGETDFDELDKFALNTHTLELGDIETVLKAVREGGLPLSEQLDAGRIVLVGHSRGGGDCVLYAAEHEAELRGIVSWNGIADCDLFDDEFRDLVLEDGVGYVPNARTKQEMPISAAFFKDLDQNEERYDIVARAAALKTPALFLQGDSDSPRLVYGFEELQENAPQHRYVVLEGANHTFGAVHPWAGTTDDLERVIALTADFAAEVTKG